MKAFALITLCLLATLVPAFEDKYLIVLKNEECEQLAVNTMNQMNKDDLVFLEYVKILIVSFEDEEIEELLLKNQELSECIKSIEKNQEFKITDPITEQDQNVDYQQWHLKRVIERDLPLGNVVKRFENSDESHTYVIDSGIDSTHSELRNNIAQGDSNHQGFVQDYCNDCSFDAYSPLCDCNTHGTHCAGLVASQTAGYNLHTTLHSAKVFNQYGSTSMDVIVQACDWAVQHWKTNYPSVPAVASLSLGGPLSYATDQAIQRMHQLGMFAIVAAGNSNVDACGTSPARSEYAFTIGSSDINDDRSSFSNWGSCIDLFAPGSDIWSTQPGNTYAFKSGTSMATPLVAGMAVYFATEAKTSDPTELKRILQCVASQDKLTDTKSDNNLLVYDEYSQYNPSTCSYVKEKYPELYEKHFLNKEFLKAIEK